MQSWSWVGRDSYFPNADKAETSVNGVAKPLTEITDEDEGLMTTEEYEVGLCLHNVWLTFN